jgi:hypothetical protein
MYVTVRMFRGATAMMIIAVDSCWVPAAACVAPAQNPAL